MTARRRAPLRRPRRTIVASHCGALLLAVLVAACGENRRGNTVLLATTSSVDDTGLLDSLLVRYHAQTEDRIRSVVVGSGEALELGRRRDVDVVVAHSPPDEERFMAAGHGRARYEVFRNDYLIVGPDVDPARARAHATAAEALAAIATAGATFVSRGDRSGTHQKELELRGMFPTAAPGGPGYVEAGLGMAETLRLASERNGYTLTDRATFAVLHVGLGVVPLVEGDTALANRYSVIVVADARNERGATAFADWLRGAGGQARVAEFGSSDGGPPPFVPSAGYATAPR